VSRLSRSKTRKVNKVAASRPRLEMLEERTLMDAAGMLTALQSAKTTIQTVGSNLASGPLGVDLPLLSGGANALDSILGVTQKFNQIGTQIGNITPSTITAASNPQSELQSELGSGFTVTEYDANGIRVAFSQAVSGSVPNLGLTSSIADFFGGSSAA